MDASPAFFSLPAVPEPDSLGEETGPAESEEAVANPAEATGSAIAERFATFVDVDEFRVRLIPRSRANLFRYALFGVAGLAFVGAFGFLLAGIGFMKRE